MPRRFGFAVRPGWLAGHVIVLALAVTMVLLGRWQLDVSDSKGFDLQNFGYALQWWAFTIFGIAMWLKILRDHAGAAASSGSMPAVGPAGATVAPDDLSANGPAAAPATTVTPGTVPATTPSSAGYRRYVMPQSSDGPAPAGDAMHAAYNDYLARLAEQSSAEHGTEGTGR